MQFFYSSSKWRLCIYEIQIIFSIPSVSVQFINKRKRTILQVELFFVALFSASTFFKFLESWRKHYFIIWYHVLQYLSDFLILHLFISWNEPPRCAVHSFRACPLLWLPPTNFSFQKANHLLVRRDQTRTLTFSWLCLIYFDFARSACLINRGRICILEKSLKFIFRKKLENFYEIWTKKP